MAYRKILVPLDGSKLSEAALQHALQIAAPHGKVHILSVVAEGEASEIASLASARAYHHPGEEHQWPHIDATNDPTEPDARKNYLRRVAEWLEPLDLDVTWETRRGEVIPTILEVAKNHYEIIVLATHGRTGIVKTMVGSVTDAILEQAPCPVLVVPVHS